MALLNLFLGNIPLTDFSISFVGSLLIITSGVRVFCPPGYPENVKCFLSVSFLPVNFTFSAFNTITLSPQSTCGVKFGLYLPLNNFAILDAALPKGRLVISTTTHSLLTVALFAETVL